MNLKTTPSSVYTNWELPVSEAEAQLWQMDMPEANKLLQETSPLPDLAKHGEVLGKQFEAHESYTIDGHSVMWLASSVRKASKAHVENGMDVFEDGCRLTCECDFKYRQQAEGPFGPSVVREFTADCLARKKLTIARQINISDYLGFDARNQFRPDFPFTKLYPRRDVESAILRIIEAAAKEGEWVGNQRSDLVTVPIVQSILGMPRGGDNKKEDPRGVAARLDARWKYFHDMIASGQVIAGSAWQLTLPRKKILRV